jgi:hypothetical protein
MTSSTNAEKVAQERKAFGWALAIFAIGATGILLSEAGLSLIGKVVAFAAVLAGLVVVGRMIWLKLQGSRNETDA